VVRGEEEIGEPLVSGHRPRGPGAVTSIVSR
jgi:hypothetical protein